MKPKNILKIGFLAVAGALLSVGVKAQIPSSNSHFTVPVNEWTGFDLLTREAVDTVTVGSRMPYKVEAQNAGSGSGLTFEYKWLFSNSNSSNGNLAVLDDTGAGIPGTGDYYANSEISVVIDADVNDLITIHTNVRSLFKGAVLCTGTTDDTYDVRVVDRPQIDWNADDPIVGCSASDVSIPLTKLDGYEQFEIAYTIDHYADINKSGPKDPGSTKYLVLAGKSIELPASEFVHGEGLYEVTVTGITDRISRKSVDQTLVASLTEDLPTAAYPVIIYPTPQTRPLQHIKNAPQPQLP
jgi:hypothetical protein